MQPGLCVASGYVCPPASSTRKTNGFDEHDSMSGLSPALSEIQVKLHGAFYVALSVVVTLSP